METIGYIASVFIGISLGLIGGGGSILTVPVLVYLFGESAELSTAYSLFIVGATALVGAIHNATMGNVNYKTAVVFAIPAFIAVYLTRAYLLPAIPQDIITVGAFSLTKDVSIIVLFALVMLAASVSMILDKYEEEKVQSEYAPVFNIPAIVAEGALVGVLTGIVGAGGGFLIIPALVLFVKLPMKKAVGTSLLIIAVKSLIGFIGDVQRPDLVIDWTLLLTVTVIAVVGIFVGIYLTKFINGKKLKKGFGWLVLVMAVYIILKQIV
ncbi:MAG TPA: permease [Cryomorphaceae bacterium]|nr:permease [Cryomorphaceae bacterium]|tara:strand:- start:424 stop:1224 length:801 start_codon:yes stop_codon:yes gene_type:complete